MIDSDNVVTTARSLFEAQAEELAKYKQLATAAIDDAVALRAQLAALQCEDELPELPERYTTHHDQVTGHVFRNLFAEGQMQAYARQAQAMVRAKMVPLTPGQILNIHAMPQWPRTMFADKGYGIALDTVTVKDFTRAVESAHGITGEPK